ncbi:MAG: PKD domain-containing protein, partial [Thermoplasmata archaeon]|nr:PKD domain-containing protein [Thermoplasmata archaeon]
AYMSLGSFEVNVSVRDPMGLTDTDQTNVTVVGSYPIVDFSWTPPSPVEGQEVVFVDLTWSFDDVVLINWTIDGDLISSGLEHTITIAEFDDGYHEVFLEVKDDDGSVGGLTKTVRVLSADPVVSISSPPQADEGDIVLFEAIVDEWHDGPVDPIELYEWDFSYSVGDFIPDAIEAGNSTTWSFEAAATSETYTVAVRVTDSDGNWTIATTEIEVFDVGPSASVSLSVESPGEGEPFTFIAYDSHDGIVDWLWTLYHPGGGSQVFHQTASQMANMSFSLGNGSYEMDLQVTEADGDSDTYGLLFEVVELAPSVQLKTVPDLAEFQEFERVDFSAEVDSYDEVESYEWDFIAPGAQFVSDGATDTGTTYYRYNWTGNYTARVKVTDVDGSVGYGDVDIEVQDLELEGVFVDDVLVLRLDPNRTFEITFDASVLATRYPDIANTLWDFGDGGHELVIGSPSNPVTHVYSPVRDYSVNLTLTDDDGNTLVLSDTLHMIQPTVQLVAPTNGAVVNSGVPVRFVVSDDSLPFESVTYSVNGGPAVAFEILYEIDTTDWSDGPYSVEVRASDKDGNIAIASGITIIVDDSPPQVEVLWNQNTTYAGDRMNISIRVVDPNVDLEGVTLYVKMPGDDAPSPLEMNAGSDGIFYRIVDVPMRSGHIELHVVVEDLAGNSQVSETFTVAIKKHFIDAFWPFMLVGALLAALGTGAYFFRESTIAVDETFVIYNDGRLMAHSTRRLKPGMDDEVLGSMFVAVQDFVRDSFKEETSFNLRKLDFGNKIVLVEKGSNIFLAVVLHGKASRKVSIRMARVVDEIDEVFGIHLVEWDGDLDKVRGVNDIMKKLYSRAPAFPGSPRRDDG